MDAKLAEPISLNEKYLETLRVAGQWLTVAEWAIRVGMAYPEVLANANAQAAGQKNPTTGIREIAARLSSQISRGAFSQQIEVDQSERPKRVRYLSDSEQKLHEDQEILEDVAPLTRSQKIKADQLELQPLDQYRLSEFENIVCSLRDLFSLELELDHCNALLNSDTPGNHHPDNLQILLRSHNRMKSSNNWRRFKVEEQIVYLKDVVRLQKQVSAQANIEIDQNLIDALMERLRKVY